MSHGTTILNEEDSMEKAYDLKELGKKLKEAGLPIVEEISEEVVSKIFDWLKESAVKSKNPYDDMAAFVYPKIEEFIKEKLDEIDGQEG